MVASNDGDVRGIHLAMATTRNTRTLRAYVSDLLEYPRWIIEREVDFSDCAYEGHYNAFLAECVNCKFGRGCRWLDQQRIPNTGDAPLDAGIPAFFAITSRISRLPSKGQQQDAAGHPIHVSCSDMR